ncbi:hypothetical protein [Flavobacterium terrigena]|uniref:Dolichyl-phosphate-mannose-protein mannosyltransferase n=1 Tax=Flavobacterium terrigena TaxID=402734 RepID=A0A1H6R4N8_9FLAO|nr:hypothetical protein [Flavobacterium terrigena]SEI48184.1 hypothetical protein SAMN05660918_0858 [Flavobacterium terrigena]
MKLNKLTKSILLFTVIVNLVITIIYCFNLRIGGGDEILFLEDLKLIQEKGWIHSIEKGISIPYMLLSYLFSFLFTNLQFFRIINSALFLLLVFYFYKRKVNFLFYFCFLFFISTSKVFFSGTNDTIFFLGIIVFLCEVYFLNKNNKWNSSLAISALIIAFFTRQLFWVYFPAILLGFYVIYKNSALKTINYKIPAFLFLVFVAINMPSLLVKKSFSYDQKVPEASVKSNWTQRNYLSQLAINDGKLSNGHHVSWEETDAYLVKNGMNSLPKTTLESAFFDLKLTFTEFFKNLFYASKDGFRQLGLIFFIPFILVLYLNKIKIKDVFIPISTIITLFVLCFILILNIEIRWLIGVFIPLILYYSELKMDSKWFSKFNYLNIFLIFSINVYAIITLSLKLKNQIL